MSSVEALNGLMDRAKRGATVKVGTANRPQRQGEKANDRLFQRLADMGCTVLAGQEIPDEDAARLCPDGWGRHRPGRARSEVLYWDRREWECLSRGAFKISSDKAPADRFIVWALLRHRETGAVKRIGCAHFVAFKTSRWGHEYEHQQKRAAEWLARGGDRVLMGDLNGSFGGRWLRDLERVGEDHTPKTRSGPDGQNIDLIVTSKGQPRARKARTINDGDPDHKPVVAELPLR